MKPIPFLSLFMIALAALILSVQAGASTRNNCELPFERLRPECNPDTIASGVQKSTRTKDLKQIVSDYKQKSKESQDAVAEANSNQKKQ